MFQCENDFLIFNFDKEQGGSPGSVACRGPLHSELHLISEKLGDRQARPHFVRDRESEREAEVECPFWFMRLLLHSPPRGGFAAPDSRQRWCCSTGFLHSPHPGRVQRIQTWLQPGTD